MVRTMTKTLSSTLLNLDPYIEPIMISTEAKPDPTANTLVFARDRLIIRIYTRSRMESDINSVDWSIVRTLMTKT